MLPAELANGVMKHICRKKRMTGYSHNSPRKKRWLVKNTLVFSSDLAGFPSTMFLTEMTWDEALSRCLFSPQRSRDNPRSHCPHNNGPSLLQSSHWPERHHLRPIIGQTLLAPALVHRWG